MKNGNGVTAQEMIAAIKEANGFVIKAADILGISRSSFYNHMNRYTTVKKALEDTREKRHEHVETKLMTAIDKGNLTAIIFYLKTQGKHLGYVERQEVEQSGTLQIEYVNDWRSAKD